MLQLLQPRPAHLSFDPGYYIDSQLAPLLLLPKKSAQELAEERFLDEIRSRLPRIGGGAAGAWLFTDGGRTLLLTFAPVVVATAAGKTVVPGTRALVLLSFAPRVAAPRTVVPATRALVLLTFAPAATAGHKLTPPTLALLLLTFAPLIAHVTSHPDNIIELRGGLGLLLLAGLISVPLLAAGAYDVELLGSSEALALAGDTGAIMLVGG